MTYPEYSTARTSSAPSQSKPVSGHDSVLRAIQNQGRTIHVQLVSGDDDLVGVLTGRDKFTMTVKTSDGIRRVVYKHAIQTFWAEETSAS